MLSQQSCIYVGGESSIKLFIALNKTSEVLENSGENIFTKIFSQWIFVEAITKTAIHTLDDGGGKVRNFYNEKRRPPLSKYKLGAELQSARQAKQTVSHKGLIFANVAFHFRESNKKQAVVCYQHCLAWRKTSAFYLPLSLSSFFLSCVLFSFKLLCSSIKVFHFYSITIFCPLFIFPLVPLPHHLISVNSHISRHHRLHRLKTLSSIFSFFNLMFDSMLFHNTELPVWIHDSLIKAF